MIVGCITNNNAYVQSYCALSERVNVSWNPHISNQSTRKYSSFGGYMWWFKEIDFLIGDFKVYNALSQRFKGLSSDENKH